MKAAGFLFLFFLFCPGHLTEAKVIGVPQDYDTIQKAIDASSRSDIIRVSAGTYYENINIKDGRSLIGAGADITFLIDDGKGPPDPVVYIAGDVTFQGFTVTGGRGAGVGHAVMVARGFSRIIDNIIRDNSYTGLGLHSEVYYTAPIIVGNKIFGNGGAGIANLGRFCKPVIRKNEIYNNTNVGIAATDHAFPLILENNIHDNGAGIAAKGESKVEILKNLVVGNKLVGVNISQKAKGTMLNNNIMANGSTGVNLDQSLFSFLEKNTIVDNAAEGVYVKSHSIASINNNIITGNLPTVFYIDKSTVTLTNNQIYAQDQGGLNLHTIRVKKSKVSLWKNQIMGEISADDASEIVDLPPKEQPSPPPLLYRR